MPILDLEIRERLSCYMAGDISLSAFREWFSSWSWNIDQRADVSTARMVHEIDLVLAEFDHEDWTEEEIRRQFIRLLAENSLIYLHEAPWVQKSTSSTLGQQPPNFTKYFGAPPLFQSPRIQPSQLKGLE